MKNRITRWALVVALGIIGTAIYVPSAQASLKGIDGVCGAHRGKLVWRSAGHEQYHVRFGVKRGHYGGSHRCHGRYKKHVGGGTVSAGVLDWHPFDLPDWRYRTIADVAAKTSVTIGACGAFAVALTAELPSAGAATVILAGTAGGCYQTVSALYSSRNEFAHLRR